MPIRKACLLRGPGCSDGGLALPGRSRCRAHGGGAWARTNPANKKHYGADWRTIRARVLREQLICALCPARATDVDHVIAVADGGTDNRTNLRGLCERCHKKYTAEQNRARRQRRKGQR